MILIDDRKESVKMTDKVEGIRMRRYVLDSGL